MADSFSIDSEMSGRRKFLVAATSVAGGCMHWYRDAFCKEYDAK